MPLVPLALPDGMYTNGTDYQAKGRWWTGNRVRWHDGSLRAIGGWVERVEVVDGTPMPPVPANPATEKVRDIFFWNDAQSQIYGMLGSNLKLYYLNGNNEVTDITPAGFVPGPVEPVLAIGYGTGFYGRGTYGTPRSASGALAVPAQRWEFDNWGSDGLAMAVQNGPIYSFNGVGLAVPVPNAPVNNADFIVTNERMVMVIDPGGGTGDSREVRWSDSENREQWAPLQTNQAGSLVLPGVGALISIHRVLGQILILSKFDAQIGRYLGPPYIYGFEPIGTACGPISAKAVVATDRFAIWLGVGQFWMYDGTLQKVPCDVIDYLRRDMDPDWASAIHAHSIAEFNEIWWHYKSLDGDEVDSYVAFDYVTRGWHYGRLDRTASHDKIPIRDPLYIDHNGVLWNHEQREVGIDDAYAITGPIEIGAGDQNAVVHYIYPDTEVMGEVSMTLFGRQMPTAPELIYGPYPYANPTPVRVMGREVRLRVDGIGTQWEVGVMRLEVTPGGAR